MWECPVCSHKVDTLNEPVDTCREDLKVQSDFAVADPIRYGREYDPLPNDRCPDCFVAKDGVHHPGCSVEECPFCKKKIMDCGCF